MPGVKRYNSNLQGGKPTFASGLASLCFFTALVAIIFSIIAAIFPIRTASAETSKPVPNIFEGCTVSFHVESLDSTPPEAYTGLKPVYDTSYTEWQGINLTETLKDINMAESPNGYVDIELAAPFEYDGFVIRCTATAYIPSVGINGSGLILPGIYLINSAGEALALDGDHITGLYTLNKDYENLNIVKIQVAYCLGGSILIPTEMTVPEESEGDGETPPAGGDEEENKGSGTQQGGNDEGDNKENPVPQVPRLDLDSLDTLGIVLAVAGIVVLIAMIAAFIVAARRNKH